MVDDSKTHEAEDIEKQHKVEIRNQADHAVFSAEKNLKEVGDKIDADTKARIQTAIERVKAALKGENSDEIKSAADDLTNAWHTASQQLYQQRAHTTGGGSQPGGPNGPGGGQSSAAGDGSVQADYEVVDE